MDTIEISAKASEEGEISVNVGGKQASGPLSIARIIRQARREVSPVDGEDYKDRARRLRARIQEELLDRDIQIVIPDAVATPRTFWTWLEGFNED